MVVSGVGGGLLATFCRHFLRVSKLLGRRAALLMTSPAHAIRTRQHGLRTHGDGVTHARHGVTSVQQGMTHARNAMTSAGYDLTSGAQLLHSACHDLTSGA
jgi:hypothetical protein